MIRLLLPALALPIAALALPVPASAAVAGDVAACVSGQPSLLVRLSGFREAAGNVRVVLYRQQGWLQRGGSLKRVRVPVTAPTMNFCLATPGAGRFAVAVHHDANNDRRRNRTDGAGFLRNPRLSLTGRPSFASSQVEVGNGVTPIAIQIMYLRGLSVGPVRGS